MKLTDEDLAELSCHSDTFQCSRGRALTERAIAEEIRELCQREADEFRLWIDNFHGRDYDRTYQLRRDIMFDPWFYMDPVTTYDVQEVCEDPREQYETLKLQHHIARAVEVEIAKPGRYCDWCGTSQCHGGCTQ